MEAAERRRVTEFDDEIDRLEAEALVEKHWSLKGEVGSKERPQNSLLEVHLDISKKAICSANASAFDLIGSSSGLGGRGAEEEEEEEQEEEVDGEDATAKFSARLEEVIKERILDLTFDDVVRQVNVRPADNDGADAAAAGDSPEILKFQKSRVGLGEVYAREFEKEFLGVKSAEEEREEKQMGESKRDLTRLFSKLMYKLDCLSNQRFSPKPPSVVGAGATCCVGAQVSAIEVEDTVPLVVSEALSKAPEEIRPPDVAAKEPHEMSQDERRALRAAAKERRRKKLEQRVVSGQLTLPQLKERQEKIAQANQQRKQDQESIRLTGLSVREKRKSQDATGRKKRINICGLLAAAGMSDVIKRDEKKKKRKKETSSV